MGFGGTFIVSSCCVSDENGVQIEWDLVRQYTEFPDVVYLEDSQRRNMTVDAREFEHAVVKPWYRVLLPYEVIAVRECSLN